MLQKQEKIRFSEFASLYDVVVPADHELRKLDALCDGFQFVYDELKSKYCPDNGRTAVDPRVLFKYLLIKTIDNLSDVDVVKHSMYDMSYKWFLGYMPEDKVIDPSLLTKFRRQRLQDVNLLDMLIGKSISIAKANGLLKSKTIIVDATHTSSKYHPQSQIDVLRERSKMLRRNLYSMDDAVKEQLPTKYEGSDLEKELEYQENLIEKIKTLPYAQFPAIFERMNYLIEAMEDIRDHYTVSKDQDARIGHKTADSKFFGYKTHLAVTGEGLVSAAVITSGEVGDGTQLPELVDKSLENDIEIETVIGDGAYSGQGNIAYVNGMGAELISKTKPNVAQGQRDDEGFTYNKDAEMYVCPAGHLATSKYVIHFKDHNSREVYHFSKKKCKVCKLKDVCWKKDLKLGKTYSVTIRPELLQKQLDFEKTREFKEKYRERYKVESKNADLKNNYGYRMTLSYGIEAMEMQGAMALFSANMRLIMRKMAQNKRK